MPMRKKKWSTFQKALVADDVAQVEHLCKEEGLGLTTLRSPFNESLLHVAYEQNATQCIQSWKAEAWDWSATDFRGHTILVNAIRAGSDTWLDVLRATGWPKPEDKAAWELIHLAFFHSQNELLALEGLNHGWDPIGWVGPHEQNAFHMAVDCNWAAWLEEYLKLRPHDDCWTGVNYWGNTALMSGCRVKAEEAVNVLLKHASEKQLLTSQRENKNGQTAIEMAIWSKQFELVDALMKAFNLHASSTLSYSNGVPKFAWNLAVATQTPEGLAWALRQKYWPKKDWPWQKSLALWVLDPAQLEVIRRRFPRKKWGGSWKEVSPDWASKGKSFGFKRGEEEHSAVQWALTHADWKTCEWWLVQKSTFVRSPFSQMGRVKKDRLEKLKGLLSKYTNLWVSADAATKEAASIKSVAAELTLEELELLRSGLAWTEKDWALGWLVAMSKGTDKQGMWFDERLPAKARDWIKKTPPMSRNEGSLVLFRGLTSQKLNRLEKQGDPWPRWNEEFQGQFIDNSMRKIMAKLWVSHALKHPVLAMNWLDKVPLMSNDLRVEILNHGLKYRRSGVTRFLEKVAVQTEFFKVPKNGTKKSVPLWQEWMEVGNLDCLNYYFEKGWFDESHAINKVKNGWCVGGLKHPKQAHIAWGLWAAGGSAKTEKKAFSLGEWLHTLAVFDWKHIKFKAKKKPINLGQEHWRWLLFNDDVWRKPNAPKRPLELLWCGKGFRGDSAIHKRIVKTLNTSLWDRNEAGGSLGNRWLGHPSLLQPRMKKLLEEEDANAIQSAWSAPPSSEHPWALLFHNVLGNGNYYSPMNESSNWATLLTHMHSLDKWVSIPGILLSFVEYVIAQEGTWARRTKGQALSSEKELVNALWDAWAPELAHARKINRLDEKRSEVCETPVWYYFGGMSRATRKQVWTRLNRHDVNWNEKDSKGGDFVDFVLNKVEQGLSNRYRNGRYYSHTDPEEVSMETMFAGNDMWEHWLKLGGEAPLDPVERSMAVRLAKWGEWRKWWEHRQLHEKHATIIMKPDPFLGAL
jgi:hypothetical protein